MRTYIIGLILLVAAAAGAWYWFAFKGTNGDEMMPQQDASQVTANFLQEGNIVKNNPGLKVDTWYLQYERQGTSALSELAFDRDSTCAGRTASGECNPAIFINGRKAKVEGVTDGPIIHVQLLTFTQPLSS